jgi:murein tripeptide amidase MpaA
MPRYRITISASSKEAVADLIRKHRINVFDHGRQSSKDGPYIVDALADDAQMRMLETQGYKVECHEDVDEAGSHRQREVSQENRYLRQQDQEKSH